MATTRVGLRAGCAGVTLTEPVGVGDKWAKLADHSRATRFVTIAALGLPVDDFWVGIRGDLTAEQIKALKLAGIVAYDLRRTAAAWGEPPVEWETLRTFVRVAADDDSEAKAEVAQALGLDADDLLAYSTEIFR